jgi:2-dehydro-3-deoxyphosphogluconate aldolase/(4S)-4-hydroxy-2-oxoglutarate aldolase
LSTGPFGPPTARLANEDHDANPKPVVRAIAGLGVAHRDALSSRAPSMPVVGGSSAVDVSVRTRFGSRPDVPAAIRSERVIAIGRALATERVVEVGAAIAAGGIRAFEITLNSPGALRAISMLAAHFGPGELLVGAGTVLDVAGAQAAVDAGARFLVMPHTDPVLIAWAAVRGIPAFPGAFTPTEILSAWLAGAAAVKLFPASAVGPSFVRELRGPLREIPLIPTGGVTVDSAAAYIAAGALAVGIGSWLTSDHDVDCITERARTIVMAVASYPSANAGDQT